jgi:hypothetical protein
MNAKLIVPPHIPTELHEMYREFLVAQMIQQLLVDNGATNFQAQKICGFVAARCSLQLKEPESVAQLGTGFMDTYKNDTEKHYGALLHDPGIQIRMSAQNNALRRIAVQQDIKSPVKMNITEDLFVTVKPDAAAPQPSKIILNG